MKIFMLLTWFALTFSDFVHGSSSEENVSQIPTEVFNIKICIGKLGHGTERGVHVYPEDTGYKHLKINGYIANASDVVFLKRKKYSFSSKAGSFFFDFQKEKESSFFVDAASYGGLSIEPSKSCEKRSARTR